MCETYLRLLALCRMLEAPAPPFGPIGTDAALDAWFGARSPIFTARSEPHNPAMNLG